MSRTYRAAAALCLLLAACARDEGAREGSPAETARATSPRPSNQSGGDGGIGGTGLFGTVTALGSVEMNGVDVELNDQTSIAGADDLVVGATLLVEAIRNGDELTADRIQAYHPVTGAITEIEQAGLKITVLGTTVELSGLPAVFDETGTAIEPSELALGDHVAVSGIWHSPSVVATRIDIVDGATPSSISGLLLEDGGGYRIGNTWIDPACCADVEAGQFARFEGAYYRGVLVADERAFGASYLFSDEVAELVVEAFLAPNPNDDGFHLSGFGILMDPDSPVMPEVGDRSLLIGAYDGSFQIEHSYELPDEAAERALVLDRIDVERLLP